MTVVIDKVAASAKTEAPVSVAARARAKSLWTGSLYQPRTPIYPKLAHGKWRMIKWIVLVATLSIYYVVPWIRWSAISTIHRARCRWSSAKEANQRPARALCLT